MSEKQRKVLEKIVRDYEAALPRNGNSVDDMLARTEYLLAKKMLSKVERRPVPALTPAQDAFHRGITSEDFSLENAVKLYANRSKE